MAIHFFDCKWFLQSHLESMRANNEKRNARKHEATKLVAKTILF